MIGLSHNPLAHTKCNFYQLLNKAEYDVNIYADRGDCYSRQWITVPSICIIEKLSISFMTHGKREFVARDQVSPLLVVYRSLFHT